jgi:hypothetical protein
MGPSVAVYPPSHPEPTGTEEGARRLENLRPFREWRQRRPFAALSVTTHRACAPGHR